MATISRTGISNTSTIDAEHITRIIDALDGTEATEVVASGSFSGSFTGSYIGDFSGDGTNLTGVTAEWDGTHNGNAQITGSLVVTSTISASNFTGTTSGTNTGDQDLSSYAQTANVVANSATASFIVNSVTSSMSVATASFIIGGTETASYVRGIHVDGAVASATNATNADNVEITTDDSNATYYIHYGSATSGNDGINVNPGLTVNPSTNTITASTASIGVVTASGAQFWTGGLNTPEPVFLINTVDGTEMSSSLRPGALHIIRLDNASNAMTITLPGTTNATYKFLLNPGTTVANGATLRFVGTTLNGFTSQVYGTNSETPAPYNSMHTGSGTFVRTAASNTSEYKGDYFEFTPYAAGGRYFFTGRVEKLYNWNIG